jgi:hypothetical protein
MEQQQQNIVPEWVNETPDPQIYSLVMYDGGGASVQEIDDLTREEFCALKKHLAAMRGLSFTAPAE